MHSTLSLTISKHIYNPSTSHKCTSTLVHVHTHTTNHIHTTKITFQVNLFNYISEDDDLITINWCKRLTARSAPRVCIEIPYFYCALLIRVHHLITHCAVSGKHMEKLLSECTRWEYPITCLKHKHNMPHCIYMCESLVCFLQ